MLDFARFALPQHHHSRSLLACFGQNEAELRAFPTPFPDLGLNKEQGGREDQSHLVHCSCLLRAPQGAHVWHVFHQHLDPHPHDTPELTLSQTPVFYYALWTGHSVVKAAVSSVTCSKEMKHGLPWGECFLEAPSDGFFPLSTRKPGPEPLLSDHSPSLSLKPIYQTPPPSLPPGESFLVQWPCPLLSLKIAGFGPSIKSCNSSQ